MRNVVAGLIVAFTLAIGSSLVAAGPSTATLNGQLVDAGGRGAVGQSVELVRDGVVVTTTLTAVNGEFVFAGIQPGSYVVRTMMNNRTAGTKVAVNAGESVPVTVVLPSMATASPVVASVISLFITQVVGTVGGIVIPTTFTNSQLTNDVVYINNVDFIATQGFLGAIGSQLDNAAFNVARAIKIGPYSTF